MAGTQTKDDAAVRDQATLHDTRQLLDELDALMDQMLALPIDDQDDVAPPSTVPLGPTPTISATLTLVDPTAPPVVAPPPAPSDSEVRPVRFDVASTTIQVKSSPSDLIAASTPTHEPAPVAVMTNVAAPMPVQLLPPPRPVPSARWRPDHISYQFLLWVNQRYDHGAGWLGKPGRFLRSRAGKALLGVAGLGLLGLSLAWLAKDWLGWNW